MKGIQVALLALVLAGCGGKTTEDGIPTLDVEAAIDNPRPFDLDEIAESIEFVPLENGSKESLIGSIWGMAESKNVWYVREGGNPVKLFDHAGRFISTRGVFGRGPNEFLMISNMAADRQTDNLYLWGIAPGGKWQILAYDATGAIFASMDSVSSAAEAMTTALFRDNRLIMWKQRSHSAPAPEPGTKETLLELFSSDLVPAGSIEVLDRKEVPVLFLPQGRYSVHQQGFLSDNGISLLVYETLADTVFHYNNAALSPAYILNLGIHTSPPEVFGENATMPWCDDFYHVNNIWEGDRFVILWASNNGNKGGGVNEYLVSDRDDPATGFSATGPDGTPGLFLDGIKFTPCYIRDNRLVGYIQALDIADNADALTRSDLRALASTLKEDSNPVIVIVTLKK